MEGGEDETRPGRAVRILRVEVASAAKVGAMLGCVLGFLVGIGLVLYGWRSPSTYLFPFFLLVIGALDCMILGALGALVFNLTSKLTGGLLIRVHEEPADPPPPTDPPA